MRSALILAGGRGERFWPWSRPGRPKQLLPLDGGKVLLTATIDRLEGLVPAERRVVLTSRELVEPVRELVGDSARVLAEPVGRNTAPAAGVGALLALALGAEGATAVLPADHRVTDLAAYRADCEAACATAEASDRLVTFAVRAERPDTGYGYIERGEPIDTRAYAVKSFREKPDAATAAAYVASGNFGWNSGMFFWRPRAYLDALAAHRPEMFRALSALDPSAHAWAAGDEAAFDAALAAAFPALESISIDYAVMEKAKNAAVIEARFDWDDLGSWTAWARHHAKDGAGNAVEGRALALESERCVVLGGDTSAGPVVVLGARDLIVVQEKGGTLVCPADRADEVRKAIAELDARGWHVGEEAR
jgi:mannose-1-phosphate guanylyltransferase